MFLEDNNSTAPASRSRFGFRLRNLLYPEIRRPLPTMKTPMFPSLTDRIIAYTHRYIPGASGFSDGRRSRFFGAISQSPLLEGRAENAVTPEDAATPTIVLPTEIPTIPVNISADADISIVNPLMEKSEELVEPEEMVLDPEQAPRFKPLRRFGSSSTSSGSLNRRPSIAYSVSGDKLGKLLRILVVCVFTAALFVGLGFNGYRPRTIHGKPSTFRASSSYWSGSSLVMANAAACGPDGFDCRPFTTLDTWIGVHCLGNLFETGGVTVPRVKGGSDGFYTADSMVCFAAVHAGILDARVGGCFEVRLAGSREFYHGSTKNNIVSTDFGWFPRSMEFRTVENSNCQDIRWAPTMVASLGLFALSFVWRIDAYWLNHVAAQWCFYYNGLIMNRWSGEFWQVVNDLSAKQFTLIPMCIFLFHFFGRPGFCPDPKRFPMEALIFFCACFWTAAHIEDLGTLMSSNFTFTAEGFRNINAQTVIFLCVLAAVVPILCVLQLRVLYRAGLFPYYLVVIFLVGMYFVLVQFASDKNTLEFHFHHYFLGLIMCVCGRGQRKYSIVIQAVGLALFVEGLAVWDTDPMFNEARKPVSGYQYSPSGLGFDELDQSPIFTRIEFDLTSDPLNPHINLEWILPSDLVTNYTCNDETTDLTPGIVRVVVNLQGQIMDDPTIVESVQASSTPGGGGNDTDDLPAYQETTGFVTAGSVLLPPDLGPLENRTQLFSFRAYRNGILFPKIYTGGSLDEILAVSPGSTQFTVDNPIILNVALVNGGESFRIPIPFPFGDPSSDYYYHAPNATFCERLYGIYSKLRMIERTPELAAKAWWFN